MTYLKAKSITLILSVLCSLVFFSASADEFSDLMGDVPLMEGLQEDINQRLIFDKSEGRIVETAAFGNVEIKTVWDFYQATLPEMGWQYIKNENKENSLLFSREGETLEINVLRPNDVLEIKYSLYPS